MWSKRYHAVMEVLAAGVPVVEVAERYGVLRKTVHSWLNRYRDGGLAGLADRSHRPRSHPWQVAPAVEVAICELRRATRRPSRPVGVTPSTTATTIVDAATGGPRTGR